MDERRDTVEQQGPGPGWPIGLRGIGQVNDRKLDRVFDQEENIILIDSAR